MLVEGGGGGVGGFSVDVAPASWPGARHSSGQEGASNGA